ncbi:hypothetical protein OOU_Y34scaffold00450g3 [Pyricularia oryzae Y34]|uniref:Uncharacterized protein n=1 Tax=Pyricularia oryzae (strain Y34) TaxID=1143189 RepID=A0AA97PMW8_PYRO3|nr:hypothetical protein OOU_Y34scaffold00450g3 [Pyricularia oryzae Y34]
MEAKSPIIVEKPVWAGIRHPGILHF